MKQREKNNLKGNSQNISELWDNFTWLNICNNRNP